MDRNEVGSVLEEISLLLELKGENPFKIRAYGNAARALDELDEDFGDLIENGKLTSIKGIGKGIEESILGLAIEGKLLYHQELRSEFPKTLFELFKIPGLGPKKIKVLYDKLSIKSLGELEYACLENRLLKLPGFGAKTQEKILEGIEYVKRNLGRFLFKEAILVANAVLNEVISWKEVKRASLAGSLRRKKEVVKDIDLLCSSEKPLEVMKKFVSMKSVSSIVVQGTTKTSILHQEGIQIDLRVVKDKEFPFALHHFTGSKEHNTAMRSRAKAMGLKMNEYGLFKGKTSASCKDEESLFKKLKMSFVPPELREDRGEIELAKEKHVFDLVQRKDLRGFFHCHTTYSDGKNTIEEMVQAAIERGLKYIGISDHSQTAFYANGLTEADLKKQRKEIERVQKKHSDIRIFWGIESDILPSGKLDYPENVLKEFDFVVASVHAQFQMTEEAMTERCLKALENKYCTMVGHPTGRILLAREGFKINLHRLMDRAQELGKYVELNANPYRLDLDWRVLSYAKEKGVLVSINPDAHRVDGIDDLDFGVNMARKGGLSKNDVLNTRSVSEVEKCLAQARS